VTGSEYLKSIRMQAVDEKLEEIKAHIMNLRLFLHKLNAVNLGDSVFSSHSFIMKHSPLGKPPTRV
jgi:hypothetical protein